MPGPELSPKKLDELKQVCTPQDSVSSEGRDGGAVRKL